MALAYIALMEQDTVSIAAPGVFDSPFYYGARAVHELSKVLFADTHRPGTDFLRDAQRAINRVRFPGVAIFISDFLMPLEDVRAVVNVMRAKNLDVTAIQVLGPEDINPLGGKNDAIAVDSETGEEIEISLDNRQREEYAYILSEHNRRVQEMLTSASIRYVRAETETPLSDFLIRSLSTTGLLK
jgi:hypothetical protein